MTTDLTDTRAAITACPSWCTLTPGHGWDSIHDDGSMSRGHRGPTFGRFLFCGSTEHQSGEIEIGVDIYAEAREDSNMTPAALLDLAAHALAAAEWLETVQ